MPYYRDRPESKDQQTFLPERLRLTAADEPAEEFWNWRGHRVHLDRYENPSATAKIVLHHGVGTNGRQMSLIAGAPLAKLGYETVALDNLGYGMTEVAAGAVPSYDDWVQLTLDFVRSERQRDPRPIFLYGLSAGGMLTYHVAERATAGLIAGIIGMTFMDQRDPLVRRKSARNGLVAAGAPVLHLLGRIGLGRARFTMALVAKMTALANGDDIMKVLMRDRSAAANKVSVRFVDSLIHYEPGTAPEDFAACPILLTQPAEDRWSPLWMSERFLRRIAHVPVTVTILDNAGHLPFEDPGLQQMVDAIDVFAREHRAAYGGPT